MGEWLLVHWIVGVVSFQVWFVLWVGWALGGFGRSVWVMGAWSVSQWIVGVMSFQKMFGLYGLTHRIVDLSGDITNA